MRNRIAGLPSFRVRVLGVTAAFVIALAALAPGAGAGPTADAAATCSDYSTQAEAQRAADTHDTDGDGIYCESLPCPCLRPGGSPTPVAPRPDPPLA